MSPLICFGIIEWHRPERVLRQFRLHQEIIHLALLGNNYIEWMHVDDFKEIGRRIMLHTLPYGIRERAGSSLHPYGGYYGFHDPYMQWYHHITRRFMTPPLHRDDMRYHTIADTTQVLVS